jgi:hypothetical protein
LPAAISWASFALSSARPSASTPAPAARQIRSPWCPDCLSPFLPVEARRGPDDLARALRPAAQKPTPRVVGGFLRRRRGSGPLTFRLSIRENCCDRANPVQDHPGELVRSSRRCAAAPSAGKAGVHTFLLPLKISSGRSRAAPGTRNRACRDRSVRVP